MEYEENVAKVKQKQNEEIKFHAEIKRKQFEDLEAKRKEKEIIDKKIKMDKLQQEREFLAKELARQKQEIEEYNM